jgi:hypothetical protein
LCPGVAQFRDNRGQNALKKIAFEKTLHPDCLKKQIGMLLWWGLAHAFTGESPKKQQ